MLRHRAGLAARSAAASSSSAATRTVGGASPSLLGLRSLPSTYSVAGQHTSSSAHPSSSGRPIATGTSAGSYSTSEASSTAGGSSPLVGDGALFETKPVVRVPTVLRPGRGRPQRLAPLVQTSVSAAGAAGGAGSGSSSSSSAAAVAQEQANLLQQQQALKERLSRLAQFKRTPVPRHLTDPFSLPSPAEIPSYLLELSKKVLFGTLRGSKIALQWTFEALKTLITNPAKAKQNTMEIWQMIKEEVHHYWLGSKLLVAEVRTSTALLTRIGRGEQLTRRERLQLKRTVGDLLRMVPFIIIVIIPFAELSLPILLKLFPNMLPSQFEKAEYRQETYRKSLNAKLELHGILQEVLQERVANRAVTTTTTTTTAAAAVTPAAADASSAASSSSSSSSSPSSLSAFEQLMQELEAVRTGKDLPSETIVKVAKLFRDDLTVDALPRGQLAALAKFVGLSPFAPEPILRYQLRTKMKAIKEDDRDLVEEGTDTLTRAELQQACESRGMRAAGLQEEELRRQLNEWLDLSLKQRVPLTLLLLSRAFQIAAYAASSQPVAGAGAPASAAAAAAAAAAAPPLAAHVPRSASAAIVSAAGQAAGNLRPAVAAATTGSPHQLHRLQQDAIKSAAAAINAAAGAASSSSSAAVPSPATAPLTIAPAAAAAAKGLQESISTLDANVLNEALLAAHATSPQLSADAKSMTAPAKAAVMAMKLEQLEYQNELIKAERDAMDSLKESERAEKEAASKRLAAEEAQKDASKNKGEVDSLVAAASEAAKRALEKQAIANAKQETVLRMRARDAAAAALATHPPSALEVAEKEKKEKEGAEALRSIAADATMARERELLANIKRAAKQLNAAEMMARGRIESAAAVVAPSAVDVEQGAKAASQTSSSSSAASGAHPSGAAAVVATNPAAAAAAAAAAVEDAGTAYLRSKLDSMLAGIEGEMERLRGDMDLKKALQRVDANRDGQVTASEIEAALKTIVKSAQTEAAAAALIRLLDSDRDGNVNVDSLNRFLSEFAERNARKEAKEKDAAGAGGASSSLSSSSAASVSKAASRRGGSSSNSSSSNHGAFSEDESDAEGEVRRASSKAQQPPKELK